jgi:tRNA threonylcarbamoyl adenosine modification protein YeaZ
MISLILDTTHSPTYIIISKNNEIIYSKKIDKSIDLSTHLMPCIKMSLDSLNLKLDDLSCMACSIGPGPYTALRAGACIIKTFSYVKNIPIVTFSSLDVYHIDEKSYFSILDAKTPGVYLVETNVVENKKIISSPKVMAIEDLKKYFEKSNNFVTFEIDLLKKRLKDYFDIDKLNFFNPIDYEKKLINFVNEKFENKEAITYKNFKLLYLRGPLVAK